MSKGRDSRIQQEADSTVEATLRDMEKIREAVLSHGLPLRVDKYGEIHTWTFDDRYKVDLGH